MHDWSCTGTEVNIYNPHHLHKLLHLTGKQYCADFKVRWQKYALYHVTPSSINVETNHYTMHTQCPTMHHVYLHKVIHTTNTAITNLGTGFSDLGGIC